MSAAPFDIKKGKSYIPHILLIGISIGTANFMIHGILNWFQWIIQSSFISLLVGYSLVTLALNKSWFHRYFKTWWQRYLVLFLAFFVIGSFASEVEQIIKALVFNNGPYEPFSAGRIYLFNSIISLALGFSFFLNERLFPNEHPTAGNNPEEVSPQKNEQESLLDPIIKIPVRQGENILLIPVDEIVYFEAFDNYSFVYDLSGNKILCDYALIFLEKRLDKNFLRVHRKYIVNTRHIKQINPHLNSRYQILFDSPKLSTITSSKGYARIVRKLIKIE